MTGVQSNLYKLTNPDGSIYYFSDTNNDGTYEAIMPAGETSKLVKYADNSYKRTYKDGRVEVYNPSGRMTALLDRNGNSITLTRDGGNKLTLITDASGRVVTLTYDASNRITQIVLPDQGTITYTYSGSLLQKVTYPDGTYRTYEYGSFSNLTGIRNENGAYVKKYTYDYSYPPKAITSSVDGTNEKVSIAFTDASHSTVTDSLGRVTTYTIDKTGGGSTPRTLRVPAARSGAEKEISPTRMTLTSTSPRRRTATATSPPTRTTRWAICSP